MGGKQAPKKSAKVAVESVTAKESLWLPCSQCDSETKHKPLTRVAEHDQTPDGDIQVWENFSVVQCQGCQTLSFMYDHACTEDLEWDPDEEHEVAKVTRAMYPSRVAGRKLLDDVM